MQKTVWIDGVEYTVATITAKVNKSIRRVEADGKTFRNDADFNHDVVIESLRAGGCQNADDVADGMPDGIYHSESPYKQVLKAALDVNGYKREEKSGEVPAGDSPASTGPSSTQD